LDTPQYETKPMACSTSAYFMNCFTADCPFITVNLRTNRRLQTYVMTQAFHTVFFDHSETVYRHKILLNSLQHQTVFTAKLTL